MERPTRRQALQATAAAGIAATGMGVASAGDTGNQRRQDSFTWADDTLYEMLDTEPPAVQDYKPGQVDSEGAPESHRPIWLVGSMDDYSKSDEVDGTEHSPHPNPQDLRVDHVVPIGGGGEFTVQWHIHLVVRPGGTKTYWGLVKAVADAETEKEKKKARADLIAFLNSLPHGDGQGNILTSAKTIRDAVGRADREMIPLVSPTGEPAVFTCPVRPHRHG